MSTTHTTQHAPGKHLLSRLRHHVTGAIERGEAQAIAGKPAQSPYAADFARAFYLSYVNEYLTVARIAEHHGISDSLALALINEGQR